MLIHKLPFQKKKYEELGINIEDEINKAFYDKNYGLSLIISGGIIIGVLFLFLVGLSSLLIKVLVLQFAFNVTYLIITALFSFLVCYILVFRNDKYLKYFEKYEAWSTSKRKQNVILSIMFILCSIALFFTSFFINIH